MDRPEESVQSRIERIVAFVQRGILHDPFGQTPLAHPVVALEYGRAHCTITNQYVLKSLLAKAGFATRDAQLIHHSVLEVRVGDQWKVVDADMFDQAILDGEGALPALDWLRQPPNYYQVDQYPRTRAFFDRPVNAEGARVTGLIDPGRSEDLGYPSYHFGAPLEFPPSRPRLLHPRVQTATGHVVLCWDRVYDRDGDLQGYRVELGSAPGRDDEGVFITDEPFLRLDLNYPGRYFYRVRAMDRHRRFNSRTHYLVSAEGVVVWGTGEGSRVAQGEDCHRDLAANAAPEGIELVAADGTYTELFEVDWRGGRGLRMVDLSDPYSSETLPFNTRSRTAQRYRKGWEAPTDGRGHIAFDVELKKADYGGTEPIAIVVVGFLQAGEIALRIALEIQPEEHLLVLRAVGAGADRALAGRALGPYYKSYSVRL